MSTNIEVTVKDNNIEVALKKLKKAVKKSGLGYEMTRHDFYGKPSERRRQREAQGRR